jgi:hypothetical protein
MIKEKMVLDFEQQFVLWDVYYGKVPVVQKELLRVEGIGQGVFGFDDKGLVLAKRALLSASCERSYPLSC